MADLHPYVQYSVQSGREISRKAESLGFLPKFTKGGFFIVANDDFTAG